MLIRDTFYFDGSAKLITLASGIVAFDSQDLYSASIDYLLSSEGSKYKPSLKVIGGQTTIGDNIITPYFFLLNGWKIKPQEASHTLKVSGILLTDDESDPFVDTDGDYRIAIQMIVPIYTETVKVGSGLSTEEHDKLMGVPTATDNADILLDSLL